MNILQISVPKSGSYWLYTILIQILEKKGIKPNSFIRHQPEYVRLKDQPLSFEGQPGVDMLDIEDEGCYYRISSVVKKRLTDLNHYIKSSSVVWTHSSFCTNSFEAFPLFDKKIYIVRDPRDRALSSARFAFNPYMQQYYPSVYSSPDEYLMNEYERLLEQWVWHVGNYLLYKDELDIHFIFYERLLLDFERELQSLLNYLEITLSKEQQEEISRSVTFLAMKRISPKHLQTGKYENWDHHLSTSQKELTVSKAGRLMQLLNFPLVEGQTNNPSVPQ
ncbi:MAG: sulfotransferase domain-containing protein, partial [Balneolales bacterium]